MTSALDREPAPVWNLARQQPKNRTSWIRPENIFAGESTLHSAVVDGIKVMRLSAAPSAQPILPSSYAVANEPEWVTESDSPVLPTNLEWQQSLPTRWDFLFNLAEGVKCFGLGERFSGLELRGSTHTLCATDNPDHDEAMDPMYQSIPLLTLFQGEETVGLFLDSPAPQRWHLDPNMEGTGRIELFSSFGWRLYIIGPTSLPGIVKAFTSLTGRASLPPRWALGYFQSRWSYPDEQTVRQISEEFRTRKIPCDTIVLDIDYMDGYRIFTVARERFPQLQKMVADLGEQGFKVVPIVDPGIKNDPNYSVFLEGVQKDYFCKTAEGRLFLDGMWGGTSALPDFLKKETRDWWIKQLAFYTENGFAGIWNDMNEPTILDPTVLKGKRPLPDQLHELPPETEQPFLQEYDHRPVGHLEVRNLYGLLMCQATHEALISKAPDQRPFVLTRSAYAGIQRYSATWLGDNKSFFEHLAKSIPMLLNVGLSGVAFSGVDVGGFGKDADSDLLVRWFELGIFYPFFRNHSAMGTAAQEPWAHSASVESHCRKLIETRYRLLPYIQALFWEHLRTGAPLMRPLAWQYPHDLFAVQTDDQFFFGNDILVAPVLQRGKTHRLVYFPRGLWHPFGGGQPFVGGKSHIVEMPLGTVPAFVRDGAIIPLAGVMQNTVEYDQTPITFAAFGDTATGVYFEDDGQSFAYQSGQFNEWLLRSERGTLKVQLVHKGFEAPKREYLIEHGGITKPIELTA